MKDYKSLTCLEIKQILKKHNVSDIQNYANKN